MIYSIIVGLLAGFIAGKLTRGGSFGWITNLFLCLIGGIAGRWLFTQLNISWDGGIVADIGTSVVGAVCILWIASLVKK